VKSPPKMPTSAELAILKSSGLGIIEAMKHLLVHHHVGLGEAKEIVSASGFWSQEIQRNEAFHAEALKALDAMNSAENRGVEP
jgi:ribosomal protein L7/L12